jgi:hypothetical protein
MSLSVAHVLSELQSAEGGIEEARQRIIDLSQYLKDYQTPHEHRVTGNDLLDLMEKSLESMLIHRAEIEREVAEQEAILIAAGRNPPKM